MIFKPQDDEEFDNQPDDFFEDSTPVPPKPAEPKRPVFKPDEPDYWAEEEPEFEHLASSVHNRRAWIWLVVALVAVTAMIAFWLRYFSPYEDEAVQFGYVESIARRGTVFKTFEGVLLPYKELHDTTRLYTRDFIFTASSPAVATALKRMQLAGLPVKVTYKRYHATLPWRGEAKTVITAVDTADAGSILPPEYRPQTAPQYREGE